MFKVVNFHLCCTIQIDFVTWLFCLLYDCYTHALLYACVFLLEIGPWISWCYSFSWSFMKPVNNLLLWIESVFFVDIYLRWWTSIQLILNLKWNYDAETQSHVLSVLLLLIFLVFFVWTKIAIMWHLCTCKQCVTLCTKLLCIVCLVLYCNLMFCFCKISIQMLNLKVCFCNYFLKLETMMWCVCCCSRKNIYQEWLDENFWS